MAAAPVQRLEWFLLSVGIAAQIPALAAQLRATAARGDWPPGGWARFRSFCAAAQVGDPMPPCWGLPPGGRDLSRPLLAGLRAHMSRIRHSGIARRGELAIRALEAACAAAPERPAWADVTASRALAALAAEMVRQDVAPWSMPSAKRRGAAFPHTTTRAACAAAWPPHHPRRRHAFRP